jgi:membrane protein YdbS with pleckstrin-like domain
MRLLSRAAVDVQQVALLLLLLLLLLLTASACCCLGLLLAAQLAGVAAAAAAVLDQAVHMLALPRCVSWGSWKYPSVQSRELGS